MLNLQIHEIEILSQDTKQKGLLTIHLGTNDVEQMRFKIQLLWSFNTNIDGAV